MANLFSNPDFEVNTTGWIGANTATIARSTTQFHSGVASCRVTIPAVNDGITVSPRIAVTSLQQYLVLAWVRLDTSRAMSVGWNEYTAGGSYVTTKQVSSDYNPLTTTWTPVSFTAKLEATTGLLEPFWSIRGATSDFYFDDAFLDIFLNAPVAMREFAASIASNRLSRPRRIGQIDRTGTTAAGEGTRGFGPGPPIVTGAGIAFGGPKVIRTRSRLVTNPSRRTRYFRVKPADIQNPIPLARGIEGYLAPLRFRPPPRTTYKLRPPTVVVTPTAFPPIKVELAPSHRQSRKALSGLGRPIVIQPLPLSGKSPMVVLAGQRRGTPKSFLRPPAAPQVVTQTFTGPKVTLAASRRGKVRSTLRPPTVVFTAVELSGPSTKLTYSRRGVPKSFLRAPAIVFLAEPYLRPIKTTLVRIRPQPTTRILGGPVVINAAYGPQGGVGVQLAPSSRGRAKSRLSPPAVVTPSVTQTFVGPKPTLTYSRRGKAKYFLRGPVVVDGTPQVYTIKTRLAPSKRGAPHSFLRPPTIAASTQTFSGPKVTLVKIRPRRTISRLTGPSFAFPPIGFQVKVKLAPSKRGRPISKLSPPTVVFPFRARPIETTLAYSLRGRPKSRLRPPVVVAAFIARPIEVTLTKIRPVATRYELRPPTDLVDQADVGTLRVHLAPSKRGRPMYRLAPPTVVATVLARPIKVTLAPQKRGAPKSILHPPVPPETFPGVEVKLTYSRRGRPRSFFIATPIARGAVELSGPTVTLARIRPVKTVYFLRPPAPDAKTPKVEVEIRTTFAPQRRGNAKAFLRAPQVVFLAAPLAHKIITSLAYSRRGQAKSKLPQASLYQPVTKVESDLKITLAPQRRGRTRSFLRAPTVITRATPYLRPVDVTLAPQRRGKPKSALRPPVVLRQFVAPALAVHLTYSRRGVPKSRLRPPVVVAVFTARPIKITLAPQRRGIPKSKLRQVVYPARVYAPIRVTLAPSSRLARAPHSQLSPPAVVGAVLARAVKVTLVRIRPPATRYTLRPPVVVGPPESFQGPQVTLAYSVRGKTKSRLSFLEGPIVECYGDVVGFDFGPDVCGDDDAALASGSDRGDLVLGSDSGATVTGASAAGGSVTGGDAKREGC